MNPPPQPGKRIVSKGEYTRARLLQDSMDIASFFLSSSAVVCVLGTVCLLLFFCTGSTFADQEGQNTPIGQIQVYVGFSLFLTSIGAYLLSKGARIAQQKASAIDPGIPIHRANTADLPAPESLVRASEAPVQNQETVLLRAATEGQETPSEQLVRPAGE